MVISRASELPNPLGSKGSWLAGSGGDARQLYMDKIAGRDEEGN